MEENLNAAALLLYTLPWGERGVNFLSCERRLRVLLLFETYKAHETVATRLLSLACAG